MFKVGDKVWWESQSAGSWTQKEGKVVGVVPEGKVPDRILTAIDRFWKRMYDGFTPRNHESYLVEVAGGKTIKAMPRLYWPRTSALNKS